MGAALALFLVLAIWSGTAYAVDGPNPRPQKARSAPRTSSATRLGKSDRLEQRQDLSDLDLADESSSPAPKVKETTRWPATERRRRYATVQVPSAQDADTVNGKNDLNSATRPRVGLSPQQEVSVGNSVSLSSGLSSFAQLASAAGGNHVF